MLIYRAFVVFMLLAGTASAQPAPSVPVTLTPAEMAHLTGLLMDTMTCRQAAPSLNFLNAKQDQARLSAQQPKPAEIPAP